MNRRSLLATLCATTGVALGGCTSPLSNEIPLHPNIRTDGDARQIAFTDGTTDRFRVTVRVGEPMGNVYPVTLTTGQMDTLALESLELTLHTTRRGVDEPRSRPPATVVLDPPTGDAYQDLRYYRDSDQPERARIELPAAGELGEEDISLDAFVIPYETEGAVDETTDPEGTDEPEQNNDGGEESVPVTDLNVGVAATLSDTESWTDSYSATSRMTVAVQPLEINEESG